MPCILWLYVLWWAHVFIDYALCLVVVYLTEVWKLNLTHAAGIANLFFGMTAILPLGFKLISASFKSLFSMIILSNIVCITGLSFLSISTPPVLSRATGTCSSYEPDCIGLVQKIVFFAALSLIAVGRSGHFTSFRPSVIDPLTMVRTAARTGLIFHFATLCQLGIGTIMMTPFAMVLGVALDYVKPWSIKFGIPAMYLAGATVIFFGGSHLTDFLETQGSLSTSAEIKSILSMIPMCTFFVLIGIVSSIGNTYFMEQANNMNHMVGRLKVPIPIFVLFHKIGQYVITKLYRITGRWLSKKSISKKCANAPPGGILVSMVLAILCCISAAKVEAQRLDVINSHGLLDKPEETIPMSMFWLVPQFLLLGGLEGISNRIISRFLMDQIPDSMLIRYLAGAVFGVGIIGSTLSVYVAEQISGRGGKPSWFQDTLNKSRLDNYYWTLAALAAANLVLYVLVSFWVVGRRDSRSDEVEVPEFAKPKDNLCDNSLFCCWG